MKIIKVLTTLLLLTSLDLNGQTITKSFNSNIFDSCYVANILDRYGYKKTIPKEYQAQIATTLLYFPELKDVRITFRQSDFSSPLLAKPTVFSALVRTARKRHYIIGISDSSFLEPIIFRNLPLDAQIGVLGHELSHISEFIKRDRIGLMSIAIGHFSRKYLDRIEYDADCRTIDHGLGYQLLAWSEYVRLAYALNMVGLKNIENITDVTEHNPRERYMFPETIKKNLNHHPIYHTPFQRTSE
jgi:hypothetical protein